MEPITLPSGRTVELTRDPTWGDWLDAKEAAETANLERGSWEWSQHRVDFARARLTRLAAEDVRQFSPTDGQAFQVAMLRLLAPEATPPFSTAPSPSST